MSSSGSEEIVHLVEALLAVSHNVSTIPSGDLAGPDCVRLARKVSLLCHLFEEIREFATQGDDPSSPSSSKPPETLPSSCLEGLLSALEAVRRFLMLVRHKDDGDGDGDGIASPTRENGNAFDQGSKNTDVQFQYVTWQLGKALGNFPYEYFGVSDEIREQVELVRSQLRRVSEKNGSPNLKVFSELYKIFSPNHCDEATQALTGMDGESQTENIDILQSSIRDMAVLVAEVNGNSAYDIEQLTSSLMKRLSKLGLTDASDTHDADTIFCDLDKKKGESKNPEGQAIPEDFRCPISLELMRDPVIVSTGQTYERSSIQRWIDGGNRTCPKTQQKLQNLTLTPNYVLRSLIMQWCEANHFEQPINGRIRKSDGTYHEVSGDRAAINELVLKLSSSCVKEQRSSAAEIRSLAKRSTDNRILIAEAGAIPILLKLLSVDDQKTQEHAVTAILNLSIYENNKMLIMLAGAVTPIVQVLRTGSMEARENAAAAIFSLSIDDENKITIGSTPGAIDELVELLQSGSLRGRKDAATALFNLCIYQGNKARAVRAGILAPLHKMLTDNSSDCMVSEALTMLSVLVSHQEGKVAMAKSNMIPILIDLLRTGQPRNKENAAAILLALCKKDHDNLTCLARLGASIPLGELAKSGTDRAKRKANSLLDHLSRLHGL